MTHATSAPTATSDATGQASLARHRTTIIWVLAAVAVLVLLAVVTRDRATYDGPLDPRNPESAGAQALARVLDDHGVEVTVARGQDALLRQQVDSTTAVVVSDPEDLGPSTLRRLRSHTSAAGALVLVGDARVLGAQLGLDTGLVPRGRQDAACDLDLARGLSVRTYGGQGLRAAGCFGQDGTSVLVQRGALWLLTSPSSISNRHVLEEDNAALALRLLGQEPHLVWYVADPADLAAGEGFSIGALLPPWLGPAAILLVVAVLTLMLWRGRRLGPLVTEPLPVVVRAIESTQSRGRIYRRTNDRAHASGILLEATRRRLAETLGLPPRPRPEALADAAAARAGRDPAEVRALLATAPTSVTTNARLADLGRRLVQLENEVSTP
jgi:hypothetical protein